ncbi:MAG: hypothetical protein JRI45_02430 [Deltaproteobacteria bacterium]|nr:hypothetical protein [Deltaproteobacteria bacterium]MBW2068975.1 hypothetical protein [Deltaproteobacteria bacterium]
MKKLGKRNANEINLPLDVYWNDFVDLSRALCKNLLIPKGVWRFESYEEEKEWEIQMLAGRIPPQDHLP